MSKQKVLFKSPLLFILCALGFLLYQILFNYYTLLGPDEFWFVHHIRRYQSALPYRDFDPYKTVLGYYLLLIPMQFSHSFLSPLLAIKNMIAVFNLLFMMGIVLWLKTYFRPRAIALSSALIFLSPLFLIYLTNIRVDLLAYWVCLVAALLLLEKKTLVAGLLIGLGFIISPKALWYWVAATLALLSSGFFAREYKQTLRAAFSFNAAALIFPLTYLIFWSLLSSLPSVINSLFYQSYLVAAIDSYLPARHDMWRAIISRDPLIFLLLPFSWLSLFFCSRSKPQAQRQVFITIFATVLCLELALYKQPFTYNSLTVMPALVLLYAAFFSWCETYWENPNPCPSKKWLGLFMAVYFCSFCFMLQHFSVNPGYHVILLLPLFLWLSFFKSGFIKELSIKLFWLGLIFTGLVYPLFGSIYDFYISDGRYQRQHLQLMQSLLQPGDEYVAGVPLLYDRDQPIASLRDLVEPQLDYLYLPTPKLLALMKNNALELAPMTQAEVISAWQKAPVKFYLNSQRMTFLPPAIKKYLAAEYQHYWGSLYLYAPLIAGEEQRWTLKFSGTYLLLAKKGSRVRIDGQEFVANSSLSLAAGLHHSLSRFGNFRLKFLPSDASVQLSALAQKDEPWNLC